MAYLGHPVSRRRVWTPREVFVDICTRNGREETAEFVGERILRVVVVVVVVVTVTTIEGSRRELDLADGRNEGDDVDPVHRFEVFFRDSTCGNAACTNVRVAVATN